MTIRILVTGGTSDKEYDGMVFGWDKVRKNSATRVFDGA
jgi:hypothetical protein